jgi:hypothetical protein
MLSVSLDGPLFIASSVFSTVYSNPSTPPYPILPAAARIPANPHQKQTNKQTTKNKQKHHTPSEH